MALTALEIIEVLEKAKALGITHINVEGLEASFGNPIAIEPADPKVEPVPELKAEDIVKPMSVLDDLDDDEILYWSCEYGLEIEATKQRTNEKKEE